MLHVTTRWNLRKIIRLVSRDRELRAERCELSSHFAERWPACTQDVHPHDDCVILLIFLSTA